MFVATGVPAECSGGSGLSGRNDAGLIDELVRCERVIAAAHAVSVAVIAELVRRRETDPVLDPGPRAADLVAAEVAAALRWSHQAASGRVAVATELAGRLPATAVALRDGRIDLPRARVICDAVAALDDRVAAAVEARVLPKAGGQTVGQLGAVLRRAVLAADPAAAEKRHQAAVADRQVTLSALPDGMAGLWAVLAADAAAAVYAAIDDRAREAPADERGMDARRADALVDLVTGTRAASVSSTGRHRPLVHLTVPVTTVLGTDDAPGELAGYGPIPASMARRIAADSTGSWRRILTDPATGAVLDVGRRSYTPPAALARHVAVRDRTCRFPGCRQPAHRCDLDHVIPYPAGPTSARNLAALCRRNHLLKHRSKWTVTGSANGTLTWTAPTGHIYRTHPPPVSPVT